MDRAKTDLWTRTSLSRLIIGRPGRLLTYRKPGLNQAGHGQGSAPSPPLRQLCNLILSTCVSLSQVHSHPSCSTLASLPRGRPLVLGLLPDFYGYACSWVFGGFRGPWLWHALGPVPWATNTDTQPPSPGLPICPGHTWH